VSPREKCVQARLTTAVGLSQAAVVSPLTFVAAPSSSATAEQPLLSFYFHSLFTSATKDTLLLTAHVPVNFSGPASLNIVAFEEDAGGEVINGSPVSVFMVPGAIVHATWTAAATATAGQAVSLDVAPMV
jgi:hypothetical protein